MAVIKPATGSETRIAFVAETTVGTTPATPSMIVLPFVKFDVNLERTTLEDNSVYADRQPHFVLGGLSKVNGTISGNLSHTNFSPLIQTAMFSTFASNVIKVGTTLNTLTLERWHPDITKGFVATGCFADKLALKFTAAGLATLDATISGIAVTTETAPLQVTPTAAVAEQPFTLVSATLMEGGSAIGILTSLDITIDNKSSAIDVMGQQTPAGYTPGMVNITGTANAYVLDLALYTKFQNSTSTSIDIVLTDGTNTLEINLPAVIYTAAKMSVQGQGAIMQALSFTAVKDPSSGSSIVITRSA